MLCFHCDRFLSGVESKQHQVLMLNVDDLMEIINYKRNIVFGFMFLLAHGLLLIDVILRKEKKTMLKYG